MDGNSTVRFTLAKGGPVRCVVHDATGNVVARLADGTMAVGEHRLDLSGAGLEPGVYFCQVAGSQMSQTARLTVVR